jgi:peptide/nickel transport system substrate-binding protein
MRHAIDSPVSPSPRVASRWRVLLAAAAAGLAIVALSACGGGGSSSNSNSSTSSKVNTGSTVSSGTAAVVSGPGGTVKVRSSDDLDTFDPAKTGAENMSVQALELAYDRLVYQAPDGKVKPYLAKSWTTTPDSATFVLRTGATCADGTPITPKVVAASLRYSLSQKTASPYLGYAVGGGKLKSVTTNSADNSVTVTLTKPYNALVQSFGTPFPASIICPAGLKNPKGLGAAPQGSGPYTYDKAASARGSTYVFKLRPGYNWGPVGWTAKTSGVPQEADFRVVTDETTAANLLTTGEVAISPIAGISEQRVRANPSNYDFTYESLQAGSWGSLFNMTKGLPGADPAVRHAAFLALDSNSMTKAAFSDLGVTENTMVTPNMSCYNKALSKYAVPFDVAQAKSVLEQDGYKLGSDGTMTKNGKPLKLRIVMWNTTNQLGDFIQQELQKAGIASTVKNTDINTWINALFTTKDYDFTVYSYYSAFPNPVIIPAQDASLSIKDPTYFKLSDEAEAATGNAICPSWDKAMQRAQTAYIVKPMGVAKNAWFGKGWKFAAPYNVFIDPFTIQQTQK